MSQAQSIVTRARDTNAKAARGRMSPTSNTRRAPADTQKITNMEALTSIGRSTPLGGARAQKLAHYKTSHNLIGGMVTEGGIRM